MDAGFVDDLVVISRPNLPVLPVFFPVIRKFEFGGWFESDCILSQPVQSLRCDFPVHENHHHSGGLGWRDAVSEHKFEGSWCRKGAFLAPVSARHFPISVSACRRPVRHATETGSQSSLLGVECNMPLKCATSEDP